MMALIREGPQGPPGEPGRSHSLSGRSWNSLCSDAPAVPTDSEDEGGRQIDEGGGAEPSGRRPELTASAPTGRQKLLGGNRSELVLNVWECVAETNVLFYFFLFASPSSLPSPHFFFSFSGRQGFGGGGSGAGGRVSALAQEEKQRLQHSMQISRQSADSQQASMMPQSMSQGRSQSPHSSDTQQQQKHESSPTHEPQVAQFSTMLHRVRNSQKRPARIQ